MKNFTHGLASGYVALAANVVYTLLSIKLALEFLPKAEFGVWAVSAQVAGYLVFIDLGMGSSLGRLLIDHKDDRESGTYGGMVKTGMLVFFIQGLILLAVGLVLARILPPFLNVDEGFREPFFHLLGGLAAISAIGFQTRILSLLLHANQRMDLQHLSQICQFAVKLVVLWIGFQKGLGVYSLLAAQAGGWLTSIIVQFAACVKTKVLPRRGQWGRATRSRFKEMFWFGADVFWVALGTQLITSSQTIVVSRAQGLDAAAVWAVGTKSFALVCQLLWRIFAMSAPIFSEMYARDEKARLWDRYRILFRIVSAFAGLCTVIFAFANGPFFILLSDGKPGMNWPAHYTWLLALWLIIQTQQGFHSTLILVIKRIRALKYVYFAEGIMFVLVGGLLAERVGMDAMIACSLICTLVFTFSYSVWRVRGITGAPYSEIFWEWQKPLLGMLLAVLPLGFAIDWAVAGQGAWIRFLAHIVLLGGVGMTVFLRRVVPLEWRRKLLAQSPRAWRPLLELFCGTRAGSAAGEELRRG